MTTLDQQRKNPAPRSRDHKTLLSAIKMTTTIGAVSLTLAGWGLLSRVEANNVAQAAQNNPVGFTSSTPPTSRPASVIVNTNRAQTSIASNAAAPIPAKATAIPVAAAVLPKDTTTPTALPEMPAATDTPVPTPTPLFKLDVVQWLQTEAGDPVAVVRDNRGALWYVMGTDVPRIENGQSPEYQPQPVNGGRTRRS